MDSRTSSADRQAHSPPIFGWFWISNEVADRLLKIGRLPYVVYATLARRSDSGRVCGWSQRRLSAELGVAERNVRKALKDLAAAGLIHVERSRHANRYHLTPPTEPDTKILTGSIDPVEQDPSVRLNRICRSSKEDVFEQDVSIKTKGGPQKSGGKQTPEDVPIPPELDSREFREAWSEWLGYRRERKLTRTPRTLDAQLKKLAAWGSAAAIESIHTSIANGWIGLFEPKGNQNGSYNNRTGAGPGQRHDPTRERPDDYDAVANNTLNRQP